MKKAGNQQQRRTTEGASKVARGAERQGKRESANIHLLAVQWRRGEKKGDHKERRRGRDETGREERKMAEKKVASDRGEERKTSASNT